MKNRYIFLVSLVVTLLTFLVLTVLECPAQSTHISPTISLRSQIGQADPTIGIGTGGGFNKDNSTILYRFELLKFKKKNTLDGKSVVIEGEFRQRINDLVIGGGIEAIYLYYSLEDKKSLGLFVTGGWNKDIDSNNKVIVLARLYPNDGSRQEIKGLQGRVEYYYNVKESRWIVKFVGDIGRWNYKNYDGSSHQSWNGGLSFGVGWKF